MMLLAAILVPVPSPTADFARCVSAMRNSTSFAVRAELHSVSSVVNTSSWATLAIHSPTWASMEVHKAPEAGHGEIDWRYEVHGRKVQGFDPTRKSYLSRTYPKTLLAVPQLFEELGPFIPDPALKMMSPTALERFLATFSKLNGWARSVNGDSILWKESSKKGDVTFGFSRSTGRLTKWQIAVLGVTETWTMTYMPPSAVPALSIPADTTLVSHFRIPPQRPRFLDKTTQAVVGSCFDAYEQLLKIGVVVTEGNATNRVWRSSGTISQVGPTGGWRWAHGMLTVWPSGKGVYSGKASLHNLISYLGQLHVAAEPIALAFARDDNFVTTLFTFEYGAKSVGEVELNGVPQHVVQLFGPAVKIDLGVDDKGLIRRIDSTAFDIKGKAIAESLRLFTYNAGDDLPEPPAGHLKPLPKLLPPPKAPPKPKQRP